MDQGRAERTCILFLVYFKKLSKAKEMHWPQGGGIADCPDQIQLAVLITREKSEIKDIRYRLFDSVQISI